MNEKRKKRQSSPRPARGKQKRPARAIKNTQASSPKPLAYLHHAIGIDLGGTNIKGGVVTRGGTVIARESVKTEAQGGVEHVAGRIAKLVRDLLAKSKVDAKDAAVCVGCPGPLDTTLGLIHTAPNLPGWENVALAKMLAKKLGMQVYLENDANVAAFGEAWMGAGRDARCLVMFTLGTGVGGGIVIGGRLWRGVNDTAGELGHMTIDYRGEKCSCGSLGCIEMYASATAVARRMKEAVQAGRDTVLKNDVLKGTVDAEQIHRAAVAGDALSREIIEETGRLLGYAVASVVNIFNPDYVVLHGGLVNAGDMLMKPLRGAVASRCFKASQKNLHIVPSTLAGDAGIIGAAGVCFQRADGGL